MKRAVFALILPSLITPHALSQTPQSMPSPLKGWTVSAGQWQKVKGGAGCSGDNCGLAWEGDVKDTMEIQFCLIVKKWSDEAGRNVGITWDAGDTQKSRNVAVLTPADIRVFNNLSPDEMTRARYVIALNRRIPVKARITKKGIQMMVGREKVEASIPSQKLGHLRLWITRAEVTFTKVKVKSK